MYSFFLELATWLKVRAKGVLYKVSALGLKFTPSIVGQGVQKRGMGVPGLGYLREGGGSL